jgi:hypothetical protein
VIDKQHISKINAGNLLLILHVVITALIFWGKKGSPAIAWMNIVSHENIKNWSDLWAFLLELRTGIPPIVAFIEVILSWLFGDLESYRRWIYLILAVAAFSLPVIVAMTIGLRTQIITIIICLLFSMGITTIHQCNPQMYDLLYPVLVFCVILLLENPLNFVKPFFAGLALGFLELTRPFFLFLLPVFVVYAYFKLQQKKKLLIFILPIILTTGLWHVKLFVFNNGQILWSNHTGFNLSTVWLPKSPKSKFPEPYSWKHLNSEVHDQNSENLKRIIFSNWINNPLRFLHISFVRMYDGSRNITYLYLCRPRHWILPVYHGIATTIFFLSFLSAACWLLLGMYLKRPKMILNCVFFIVLAGCLTATFNSLGQSGEEARFIISSLPAFACLPALWAQNWR